MLLLVALLVTLPVAAFGLEPDNGAPALTAETKIAAGEEVAVVGEIVTAFAVDSRPAVAPVMLNGEVASGIRTEFAGTTVAGSVVTTARRAGGIRLIAGFS